MDDDGEIRRFKWLLLIGIVFLASCYFAWKEFRYLRQGRTAEATITRVYETLQGRHQETVWVVEYVFSDSEGQERKRDITVPVGWTPPESGKLMIEYLPGTLGATRPAGEHAYPAVIVVFLCLGAGTLIIVKWWREATQPIGRPAKRRR